MIYTSYFASKKYKIEDAVSIALYPPKWFNGSSYPPLFPSKQLLSLYKQGLISKGEYIDIYFRETLSNLNPDKVYKDLDGKVLLCYEKRNDFCHRHIVREWLMIYGYNTDEL